jgi:5-hydroxyisourate hydrolase
MGISTHVLDLTTGLPAGGLAVALDRQDDDGGWAEVGSAVTGQDGRVRELTAAGEAVRGMYRLRFASGEYFAARGGPTFHPEIHVVFEVVDGARHYHVPLILSPFGYSTYRGS